MTVKITRRGQSGYFDTLEVHEDASFAMMLRNGRRVGRFEGTVDDETAGRLERLAGSAREESAAASGAEPEPEAPQGTRQAISPDPAAETVDIGDVDRRFGVWDEPEGAWGELLALLHELMGSLTAQPVMGLALEAGQDAPSAVVRHVGTEPVVLVGGAISASATLMDQRSKTLGKWHGRVDVAAGPVEQGWEVDLGLDDTAFEIVPGSGYMVSATVPVSRDGVTEEWVLFGNGGEGWDE